MDEEKDKIQEKEKTDQKEQEDQKAGSQKEIAARISEELEKAMLEKLDALTLMSTLAEERKILEEERDEFEKQKAEFEKRNGQPETMEDPEKRREIEDFFIGNGKPGEFSYFIMAADMEQMKEWAQQLNKMIDKYVLALINEELHEPEDEDLREQMKMKSESTGKMIYLGDGIDKRNKRNKTMRDIFGLKGRK